MRRLLPVAAFAVALAVAVPAQAQLRAELPSGPAGVAVFDQPTGSSFLSQYVNAETVKVSHSYELSYSSFGSEGVGLGVYTTSLRFQPSDRLAARVDVGVAHSPFGSSALQHGLGFGPDSQAQVYLRNATLAYRPTENTMFTISVQQSPFGSYASPYGYGPYGMSPYGMSPYSGTRMQTRFASAGHDALFWRTTQR
jgi:hypothetical protein